MASEKNISIDEIREFTNALFDHVQHSLGVTKVSFDHDYYYCIDTDETFTITEEEVDVVVGQLSENIEFLRKMMTDPNRIVSTLFDKLTPLLNYIAYRVRK